MIKGTIETRVNSYHNYKYGNYLAGSISAGTIGDIGKFFLIGKEIIYPEKFPDISLNLFNKSKKRVVAIESNKVIYLDENYKSDVNGACISIYNSREEMVLKIETISYENVYITGISGDLYNEEGNIVKVD